MHAALCLRTATCTVKHLGRLLSNDGVHSRLASVHHEATKPQSARFMALHASGRHSSYQLIARVLQGKIRAPLPALAHIYSICALLIPWRCMLLDMKVEGEKEKAGGIYASRT